MKMEYKLTNNQLKFKKAQPISIELIVIVRNRSLTTCKTPCFPQYRCRKEQKR